MHAASWDKVGTAPCKDGYI